jgi:hypothetical protein
VAYFVKRIAVPGSPEVAEHRRQEIARAVANESRSVEIATHVVRAMRREVAEHGSNLKQARPFKGMVQVGHVSAQAK